jgi:hypothetical protein
MADYRKETGVVVLHEMCFCEVAGTDRLAMEIVCERAKVALRGSHGPLAVNEGAGWRGLPADDLPAGTVQHRLWSAMLRGEAPHDGSDLAGIEGLLVAEAIRTAATERRTVGVPQADRLLASP